MAALNACNAFYGTLAGENEIQGLVILSVKIVRLPSYLVINILLEDSLATFKIILTHSSACMVNKLHGETGNAHMVSTFHVRPHSLASKLEWRMSVQQLLKKDSQFGSSKRCTRTKMNTSPEGQGLMPTLGAYCSLA
jgi:hypothetical protein